MPVVLPPLSLLLLSLLSLLLLLLLLLCPVPACCVPRALSSASFSQPRPAWEAVPKDVASQHEKIKATWCTPMTCYPCL